MSWHTDDHVDVGVDSTIPYSESDDDLNVATDKTSVWGRKFVTVTKLGMLVEVASFHVDWPVTASATIAELGPGG